jgi:hypothetical protein
MEGERAESVQTMKVQRQQAEGNQTSRRNFLQFFGRGRKGFGFQEGSQSGVDQMVQQDQSARSDFDGKRRVGVHREEAGEEVAAVIQVESFRRGKSGVDETIKMAQQSQR